MKIFLCSSALVVNFLFFLRKKSKPSTAHHLTPQSFRVVKIFPIDFVYQSFYSKYVTLSFAQNFISYNFGYTRF